MTEVDTEVLLEPFVLDKSLAVLLERLEVGRVDGRFGAELVSSEVLDAVDDISDADKVDE